jgi:ATP-dependent Clp protease ATP-binding subunit ClpC
MRFTIPVLVEERTASAGGTPGFLVRPLFQSEPEVRAERLGRALNSLSSKLHDSLDGLGRQARHDALAQWTFLPSLREESVDLRLELEAGSFACRLFFFRVPALGRELCCTPLAPEAVFELLPGQALEARATAVLTQHFRQREKEGDFSPDVLSQPRRHRVVTLDLELDPALRVKPPEQPRRAMLFGALEEPDGALELRKTGLPLHKQYPDDLERAVGREELVVELTRLLAAADRRPVVLVGPRQAGKTAIVHEVVWRGCARKAEGGPDARQVWHLSPARLISGMSHLGEWENRVLAILRHAQGKDRVLFFDDLPGLFTAGLSAASDLNVAQVMKPFLEKRAVRVLAEITPEAWRVLRERDRAFAELFHVLPVPAMSEAETLAVLIAVARQAEERERCETALDTVPAVLDLQRRFGGEAAFPGKAAGFLRRLAVRLAGRKVDGSLARAEFQKQTGLHPAFLGAERQFSRADIRKDLGAEVLGQDHALDAFADALLKLQARLHDPRRPLGSFLLLGPTGVGKTQAAKGLARFLFGQADRLLRFDLNEFVDACAAARLTGTPREPDGLLTGAIRRQPFSVVLFDEIEKAAPEVFDLLLAVLDEGRLTDAAGRVADFTQSLIVLTSNLGAREARSRLGFGAADAAEDAVYVGAAEKFFRPEFFNRLDRVLPFRALGATELAGIARRLVEQVCAREGLRRRDCLLQVRDAAMRRLIELGHHPRLGARALKRVIERELAQPLARRLAGTPPGTTTRAVFEADATGFALQLASLASEPRVESWHTRLEQTLAGPTDLRWRATLLAQADAFLQRTRKVLAGMAPPGPLRVGELTPEQKRYSQCREQWQRVAELVAALQDPPADARLAAASALLPRHKPGQPSARWRTWPRSSVERREANVAGVLRAEREALTAPETELTADAPVASLLAEAAWLEALLAAPLVEPPLLLVFHPLAAEDHSQPWALVDFFAQGVASLQDRWGPEDERAPEAALPPRLSKSPDDGPCALWCDGLGLCAVLPPGESALRLRRFDGTLGLFAVSVREAKSLAQAQAWLTRWEPPEPLGPTLFDLSAQSGEAASLTHLRSGYTVRWDDQFARRVRGFLLSTLPLPAEFRPSFPTDAP